jgi:hypothetical protein
MNKGIQMVQYVLQCIFYKSSRFHFLEPPRKGVIEIMANLVEFFIILERELIEHAMH